MLFTTPTQYAVLLLLLVVGWLFGLASHPGGKKWRNAYDEERLSHARYRDEAEGDISQRSNRVEQLERENAALRADLNAARARPVVAATAAQPAFAPPVAAKPVEAAPVVEPEPKRGWFSWHGRGDDLSRIRGLDADAEAKLQAEGVTRYSDLASLNDTDEIALEQRLGLPAGFIQREQWREQAAMLAESRGADHAGRFSPRP